MDYYDFDADMSAMQSELNRMRPTQLENMPKRDVMALRVSDLLSQLSRTHRRREPVVIDGEPIAETLKERLTRETRELEDAVAALAGQLSRRTAQLEHLKRFPDEDPCEDGAVIQFEKSFPSNPHTNYSYAAHRADGLWYVTGARSPQGVTWTELVSWMGLGVDVVYQLGITTRDGKQSKQSKRKIVG